MSKPGLGKWQLRDYLYFLHNQGEHLDSYPQPLRGQVVVAAEILLVAATQIAAERFLQRLVASMRRHLISPARQLFTAYGLDQTWRPQQLFDEVHWLASPPGTLPPWERLAHLGGLFHLQQTWPCNSPAPLGFRSYWWESEDALIEFWASLYLAREAQGILRLDWQSYFSWQPPQQHLGRVIAGWGEKPGTAVEVLLQEKATRPAADDVAILIIEGNLNTTIGDYVEIVGALERSLDTNIVTTGWVSPNYSGYGLKLLRFCLP